MLAQSPNGWVDRRLKTAFFQLQVDCPDNPVGEEPCWFNWDGHDSNTRNSELRDLCIANRVGGICPPSHTSAAKRGRTQQCDLVQACAARSVRAAVRASSNQCEHSEWVCRCEYTLFTVTRDRNL